MSAALTAFFFAPGSLGRPGGAEDGAAGGADERAGGTEERGGGEDGERAAAGLAAGFSAEPALAPLLIGLLAMTRTAR
jgi:hypothetical protein